MQQIHPDLENLVNDIPHVKVVYDSEDKRYKIVSSLTLTESFIDYFEKLAYNDDVYERFMYVMRLLKNPIYMIATPNNVVELFMKELRNSCNRHEIFLYFKYILEVALNIEKPLISLQRRSFQLV